MLHKNCFGDGAIVVSCNAADAGLIPNIPYFLCAPPGVNDNHQVWLKNKTNINNC